MKLKIHSKVKNTPEMALYFGNTEALVNSLKKEISQNELYQLKETVLDTEYYYMLDFLTILHHGRLDENFDISKIRKIFRANIEIIIQSNDENCLRILKPDLTSTQFYYACAYGNFEVVKYAFSRNGKDIYENHLGIYPIDIAHLNGHKNIVEFLQSQGFSLQSSWEVKHGNVQLVSDKLNFQDYDFSNDLLLIWARLHLPIKEEKNDASYIISQSLDSLKFFLKYYDVNYVDLLNYAISHCLFDQAAFLLKRCLHALRFQQIEYYFQYALNFDPKRTDLLSFLMGNLPQHVLRYQPLNRYIRQTIDKELYDHTMALIDPLTSVEKIRILCEFKCKVCIEKVLQKESENKQFENLIFEAIASDDLAIIKLLTENGANPLAYSPLSKNSTLHAAVNRSNAYNICSYLLQCGVPPNTFNISSEMPIHFAVRLGKLDVVKLFCENHAHIGMVDGRSCFHIAVNSSQYDIARYLHEQNPGLLNLTNADDFDSLFIAMMNKDFKMVLLLIKLGAIIHHTNDNYSLLHYTLAFF